MTSTEPLPPIWLRLPGFLRAVKSLLLRWAVRIIKVILVAWGIGAMYYSNLPWYWPRVLLAVAFFAFGVYTFRIRPGWRRTLVFAAVYVGVLIWWGTIKPQQYLDWRPEVARLPTAIIDGDRVTLTNVRNFTYSSVDDFTIAYEDREVLLSHLTGIDMFISYWKPGPVGHTFLSFRFDNAPPVCISIETRPEIGEGYSPIASLFKQYEIIHVVGTEEDIVGVRTEHRNEEVFLYPLLTSPAASRLLFLVYLERINELAEEPEFYHLLKDNCTLNIIRYANAAGREGGFNFRHLFNGWIDRYLYLAGYVDTTLPFHELRERSRINAQAEAAYGEPDFPERIRAGL